MSTSNDPPELLQDRTVVESDGDAIGAVGQVCLDHQTGAPSWVTVKTGWLGTGESFVLLGTARIDGDTIRVPYSRDMINGAPRPEVGVPLTQSDEAGLYSYDGLDEGPDHVEQPGPAVGYPDNPPGDGGLTDREGGGFLTRSQGQLHVGTETVETGRARLRKFVVTENQTVTVPVSHDEVRVIREPIGPGDQLEDATIGEAATDVVLTEERVVVTKETVPVEEVSVDTETVTRRREVTETVRKEQVEFDDAVAGTADVDQDALEFDARPGD